mgnify:CR=1 FL=1
MGRLEQALREIGCEPIMAIGLYVGPEEVTVRVTASHAVARCLVEFPKLYEDIVQAIGHLRAIQKPPDDQRGANWRTYLYPIPSPPE